MNHPTAKYFVVVWLTQHYVCNEILLFVCCGLCTYHSLVQLQCTHKQRQHHQTCLLALTREQNEILHIKVISSWKKQIAQCKFKAVMMRVQGIVEFVFVARWACYLSGKYLEYRLRQKLKMNFIGYRIVLSLYVMVSRIILGTLEYMNFACIKLN